METLAMIAAVLIIVFVYTIDWVWLIEKAFDLIGGCNERKGSE